MRKRTDFLSVRADGEVFRGRFVIIQILKAPDSKTKLGVITSKRFSNSAVKRNRAKRLIRESFRLIKHHFTIPVWTVIIARKMMLDVSLEAVKNELTYFFTRAHCFEADS